MRNQTAPALAKWPFFFGDLLLLGLAGFIIYQSIFPIELWTVLGLVLCVALGAWLAVTPFILEYKAVAKLAEADELVTVVAQIKSVQELAGQISNATARWQSVQEAADATNRAAKEIADRMTAEIRGFNEFLQRANDGEKSALRLETEKLRRGETEWVQAVVRMLDHVYALHQAGLRSRQAGLIEQLGRFQDACRDAARRMGLTPFIPKPEEPFNEQWHQHVDGESKLPAGVLVEETIAAGYTFQGRLLRQALVRVRDANGNPVEQTEPAMADAQEQQGGGQSQLSLESSSSETQGSVAP